MKEQDIRDLAVFRRYLELSRQDADRIFSDHSRFEKIACPACESKEQVAEIDKHGFTYVRCPQCETLFVNPRPKVADLQKFYSESESTTFWVNEFFKPKAENRRTLMFRPRAEAIAQRFPEKANGKVGEIGAGFGIFLEELQKLWPNCQSIAIEPSREMAQICADKGLQVIETMFEDLAAAENDFDLLTSFELVEHLQDPFGFFSKARKCLRPGGALFFTTLSGFGFDIQLLGKDSKSVSPPHHLNFFNPKSIELLLKRAGFGRVETSTPGRLDWNIVENSIKEGSDAGPFWRRFVEHAESQTKEELQEWLSRHGWSSHMRVIAS
jgi:SAM-dependent methyltransferase